MRYLAEIWYAVTYTGYLPYRKIIIIQYFKILRYLRECRNDFSNTGQIVWLFIAMKMYRVYEVRVKSILRLSLTDRIKKEEM